MNKVERVEVRTIAHYETALVSLLQSDMLGRHSFINRGVAKGFAFDFGCLGLDLMSVNKGVGHLMLKTKNDVFSREILFYLLLVYVFEVAQLKLVFELSFLRVFELNKSALCVL